MPGGFFTLPTRLTRRRQTTAAANQFGFELDGPVYIPKIYNGKDKTFFMASYEGFRWSSSRRAIDGNPAVFFTGNSGSAHLEFYRRRIKDPLNGNAPFPVIIPKGAYRPLRSSCSSTIGRQICRA